MTAEILECGHPPSPHESFTTGYGVNSETGARSCYACCAENDKRDMRETGRHGGLYLTRDKTGEYAVTNWPGSLRFIPFRVRKSPRGGGFGSQRTDAWFTFEGRTWHAINRGDMDLCRCRALAERKPARWRVYRGVRYVAKGKPTPSEFRDPCTCGTCGRTWDDGCISALTPAPSGRCPFEYMHRRTAT